MKRATIAVIGTFLVLGLVGCGGGDTGGTSSSSSSSTSDLKDSAQINGACPNPKPSSFQGTVSSGGACTKASDCASTCCSCSSNGYSSSSKQWLGIRCENGKCVDPCSATVDSSKCT